MSEQFQSLTLISGLFLALFVVAELLYRLVKIPAEYTRKLVHIGSGMLTLLFPLYLTALWQVAVLCGTFLLLLILSKKLGWLPSINAIKRPSVGSSIFPVAVFAVFCFYMWSKQYEIQQYNPLFNFYGPILILAFCDPLAAFVGRLSTENDAKEKRKTWAGSIAFFVGAFLMTVLLITFFASSTSTSLPATLLLAAAMGAVCALAEAAASGGWDNLTIPLSACLVLTANHYIL